MADPIRVLHVVHHMGRGGIETWLMNVLRNIDRERFRLDFMVYTTQPSAYDDEIRALGSRILPCALPSSPLAHLRDVRRILATGSYDVIHAHGSRAIGAVLGDADLAGVPTRIAHAHNSPRKVRRRLRSVIYQMIAGYWIHRSMTRGFGCSEVACASLFGKHWRSDSRCQVLYYGLDWEAFRAQTSVLSIRAELGLPQDALVIGHVGRFVTQKNHDFWIDIASEIARERRDVFFLLVGDGILRSAIQDEVRKRGLTDRFVFAGERADVPAILQAMDVFMFPSRYEGLPLALLEAQAVDLPCVISNVVTTEVIVRDQQMRRLSLGASPATWAQAVVEAAGYRKHRDHLAAWNAVAQSRFSIAYCIDRLAEAYDRRSNAGRGRRV
jgi:glycosyltransferase involved in cell wall biosynthesis